MAAGGAEHRDHSEREKLEVLRRILAEMKGEKYNTEKHSYSQ